MPRPCKYAEKGCGFIGKKDIMRGHENNCNLRGYLTDEAILSSGLHSHCLFCHSSSLCTREGDACDLIRYILCLVSVQIKFIFLMKFHN